MQNLNLHANLTFQQKNCFVLVVLIAAVWTFILHKISNFMLKVFNKMVSWSLFQADLDVGLRAYFLNDVVCVKI